MTTVRCPSCGVMHNVPDAETERLRAALAEYTQRTERTIAAAVDAALKQVEATQCQP